MDYLLLFFFSALSNLEMTDLYINSVEKVYVDKFYSSPVVTLELGSVQKSIIHKNSINESCNETKEKE